MISFFEVAFPDSDEKNFEEDGTDSQMDVERDLDMETGEDDLCMSKPGLQSKFMSSAAANSMFNEQQTSLAMKRLSKSRAYPTHVRISNTAGN